MQAMTVRLDLIYFMWGGAVAAYQFEGGWDADGRGIKNNMLSI
jgi:beta-glucosidase/6-phospho-beta-glucosidase/beta-galactosidase